MSEIEKPRTTLYPKTSGKVKDFIHDITYCRDNNSTFTAVNIEIVGTVKLHGVHADIVIDEENTIRFQSRNVENIRIENDVCGWARAMLPLRNEILKIKQQCLDVYQKLHLGVVIDGEEPVIIAGEWIGPGVQKNVAISLFPQKAFVIFGLCINGSWQPTEPYKDVKNEACRIYNICRVESFDTLSLWMI